MMQCLLLNHEVSVSPKPVNWTISQVQTQSQYNVLRPDQNFIVHQWKISSAKF